MEKLSSRKNAYIAHMRALAADRQYRLEQQQYLCDGIKTLKEALQFGAQVKSLLWKGEAQQVEGLRCKEQYIAPAELFDYACPLKNSPGPLFAVQMPLREESGRLEKVIVLENLQDPGNVGTVIRTANAFGMDAVVLVGNCADLYNPKTVRASMGAIFRQRVVQTDMQGLEELIKTNSLRLCGAALSDSAKEIGSTELKSTAVAIGSEGQGLSREFLSRCDGQLIIPMEEHSESLNAAVAAAIVMWEMRGK